MKIVIKQMDEKGVNDLTYLLTEDNILISANITSGGETIKEIERLIKKHLGPYCELNGLNYEDRIKTIKYNE